ncbi:hypothetical protein [Brachybacterium fresconis]|uniref:Uncharacterized protein n=1 Tax=Brachybacterium fresconis TaxID=173363 RepID=A0ABS4YFM4_9MICO|nr:hypothetical protein [Brachybacterium fresconis]MBP2407415.1 hypothetical protein [Brachybacterium fresconis]
MTVVAQHAAPRPHTMLEYLRTAEFSDDSQVLDSLARADVSSEVLRKIAHNPAAAEGTLEHLIELDERWLTFPVTRRADLSPAFIDRIARRLTDRNAIFHASSAPNAAPETLRYLAEHPSAPAATSETVTRRLGAETLPAV